ncbi:MAG TPA: hypothetical protein VEY10_08520 [Flavisolibacter sp.]|nr:hypothetical protein [Flavisolibacter sp.]
MSILETMIETDPREQSNLTGDSLMGTDVSPEDPISDEDFDIDDLEESRDETSSDEEEESEA